MAVHKQDETPVLVEFKFTANVDKGECKTHSGSSEEGVISDGGDGGRDVHVREGVMG